jgi:hypothetical protein
VPREVQGKPVLALVAMYAGDPDEGEQVLRPLKNEIGPPAVDLLERIPYTAFQAIVDPFSPKGWLNYHRGEHLAGLPDEAIDAYVEYGARVKSPMSQSILFRHGGAIGRVAEDATAAAIARRRTCGTRSRVGATRRTPTARYAWVREASAQCGRS